MAKQNHNRVYGIDEQTALDALAKALESPAVLPKKGVGKIEEDLKKEGWVRRTALLIQTMSGQELCKHIENDRDFASGLVEWNRAATAHIDRLEALLELMQNAQVRVLLLLTQRDDIKQVLKEVRGYGQGKPQGNSKAAGRVGKRL
jgi:hypothetical protein